MAVLFLQMLLYSLVYKRMRGPLIVFFLGRLTVRIKENPQE